MQKYQQVWKSEIWNTKSWLVPFSSHCVIKFGQVCENQAWFAGYNRTVQLLCDSVREIDFHTWIRPHNNQRHRRPTGAHTSGLGALEISPLFCNGLGALNYPFKNGLENGCPSKSLFWGLTWMLRKFLQESILWLWVLKLLIKNKCLDLNNSQELIGLLRCYQAATIRLPDCPGQPLLGFGNHDLQKNCPTGQVQIESKLTPILSHKLQNSKKYGVIGCKPST